MNNALETQVGGDHYKKLPIQPMVFSAQHGYDSTAFSILKYVTRWRDKNGIKDLEKAIHCAELRMTEEIRLHVGDINPPHYSPMDDYCTKNKLPPLESSILLDLENWFFMPHGSGDSTFGVAVIRGIQQLISENGG